MADDLRNRGNQDRSRVNVNEKRGSRILDQEMGRHPRPARGGREGGRRIRGRPRQEAWEENVDAHPHRTLRGCRAPHISPQMRRPTAAEKWASMAEETRAIAGRTRDPAGKERIWRSPPNMAGSLKGLWNWLADATEGAQKPDRLSSRFGGGAWVDAVTASGPCVGWDGPVGRWKAIGAVSLPPQPAPCPAARVKVLRETV